MSSSAGVTSKCTCKRSKCLKLYCECFANGRVCGADCGCTDCCNADLDTVALAREQIIKKNPQAFDSKVIIDTHRTGCKCKMSGC